MNDSSDEDDDSNNSEEEGGMSFDKFNPPSIEVHLSNLEPDGEDDDLEEEAIEWLRQYTNGNNEKGSIEENEAGAKCIVDGLNVEQRRNILDILLDHVHPDLKASSATKKDLILWLKSPNSICNFLFYSASGLKATMEKRGIDKPGRLSKDARIKALVETPNGQLERQDTWINGQQQGRHQEEQEDLAYQNEAIKKILKRGSFHIRRARPKSIVLLVIGLRNQF